MINNLNKARSVAVTMADDPANPTPNGIFVSYRTLNVFGQERRAGEGEEEEERAVERRREKRKRVALMSLIPP